MKTLLIVLSALFMVNSAQAEGCFPEGITFSSQSQINSFRTAYPNCAQIAGDVTISGPGITNLNGLNFITSIGGSLFIESNLLLSSLNGLESLTQVGGDLYVEGNTLLTSLNGLNNLTYIDGDLIISNNPALQTLTGLEKLTHLYSTLWIDDNPMLLNLSGLENITHVDGLVRISANQVLDNLDGLISLQQIGGSLVIGGQGHLGGIGNPALVSVTGLSQLTSIGGTLEIEYNESLTSLSGLDNILPGSILGLSIYHNDLLSECEVVSICAYLANPGGALYIGNNMTGCNSVEEVTEACLIIHAKDPEVAGFMKLTPNPVSDRLTIELGQHQVNTEMTIRNVCGQIVYHQSLKNKIHTLDMNAFPAGMYLVQVTTAEGAWTARIIKR